jgi:hypothetical protein
VVLVALLAGGCSSAAPSTLAGAQLTGSSTCQAWASASVVQRQQYATNVQSVIAVPAGIAHGAQAAAYAYGYVGGRCHRAEQAGQAATTSLSSVLAASSPTTSTAAAPSPTAEPGGSLRYVGTISQSNSEGTGISSKYSLGHLVYVPPPTPVLEACNAASAETTAQTAYARGQVVVSYTHGSLAQDIELVPGEVVISTSKDAPWQGTVAFDVAGQWRCDGTGEESGINVSFQPGETKTFPFWVLAQVLSNASPHVNPAVAEAWKFNASGITIGTSRPTVTTSGPHAGSCENEDVLMLYARLPFSVEVEGFGSEAVTVRCRAVD